MRPNDANGSLSPDQRPFRILLIAGSDRRQYNCPGVDSKARALMLRMEGRLPQDWEVDYEDLGNVYGRARIQSCNACVSTSMALCVWPCNCYEKGDKAEPDLMWDLDLYARLDLADAWAIIGPVNWFGPSTNLKAMFDRLVCMSGGNPREDLIRIRLLLVWRASRAVQALASAGLENMIVVRDSGMPDWRKHGFPVERGRSRANLGTNGQRRSWKRSLPVGAVAGIAATAASGLSDRILSKIVSDEQKQRSRQVRDGSAHEVAGPRFAERLTGRTPSPMGRKVSKLVFNMAYGLLWGGLYASLRRTQPRIRENRLIPLDAAAFFIACDGVIAPLLKLSPGLPKIPWQMNAKELANHTVWTVVAESLIRADERLAATGGIR